MNSMLAVEMSGLPLPSACCRSPSCCRRPRCTACAPPPPRHKRSSSSAGVRRVVEGESHAMITCTRRLLEPPCVCHASRMALGCKRGFAWPPHAGALPWCNAISMYVLLYCHAHLHSFKLCQPPRLFGAPLLQAGAHVLQAAAQRLARRAGTLRGAGRRPMMFPNGRPMPVHDRRERHAPPLHHHSSGHARSTSHACSSAVALRMHRAWGAHGLCGECTVPRMMTPPRAPHA